jgi:hypothetical protein
MVGIWFRPSGTVFLTEYRIQSAYRTLIDRRSLKRHDLKVEHEENRNDEFYCMSTTGRRVMLLLGDAVGTRILVENLRGLVRKGPGCLLDLL